MTDTILSPIPAQAPAPGLSSATRAGFAVASAALLAGIAGDALLRETPWGLNLALFAVVFCGLSTLVGRRAKDAASRAWMPLVLALAAMAAWRDSPTLKGLDILAILVVLALSALRAQGTQVRLAGIGTYLAALVAAALDAMVGVVLLLTETRWNELPRRGASGHALGVLRGVVIAVPLLLLFGELLASADAGFERLVGSLLRWDMDPVLSHLGLALFIAWAAAGAFRALHLVREDRFARLGGQGQGLTLGTTEIALVLGLLDLLFLAFVAVQLRWLFGGAGVVASRASLGYAEYARRGFFELTAVAALVLPLLLALHWLQRGGTPARLRLFRLLAGIQVALLYVIMASAVQRMWLYQAAYGLTESRVYATAFMAWLAVVFAWFAATVLRQRRERFAFGAVAAAVAAVAVLHAVDPDALIVRVNLDRAAHGGRFDAAYGALLSGDAVPRLVAALPDMPPADRCAASRSLAAQWLPARPEDWRAWSWGRSRAFAAVAASREAVRGACAGMPRPGPRANP